MSSPPAAPRRPSPRSRASLPSTAPCWIPKSGEMNCRDLIERLRAVRSDLPIITAFTQRPRPLRHRGLSRLLLRPAGSAGAAEPHLLKGNPQNRRGERLPAITQPPASLASAKKKRARSVSCEPGEVDAPWGRSGRMALHPRVSESETPVAGSAKPSGADAPAP